MTPPTQPQDKVSDEALREAILLEMRSEPDWMHCCSHPDEQAAAELLDFIMQLITTHTQAIERKARLDEAQIAAASWNNSKSTEAFADDMNDRISELKAAVRQQEL